MPKKQGPNAEQREKTRAELLKIARRLFATKGFAGASAEEIVAAGGMTRGALYHHFPKGKLDLFAAVVDQLQAETTQKIAEIAAKAPNPREAMFVGCGAFLDEVVDGAFRQIVLIDGPAVLGQTEWQRIDTERGGRQLMIGLAQMKKARALPQGIDPEALYHSINGTLNYLALWSAEQGLDEAERRKRLKKAKQTVKLLLEGIM